MPATIRFGVLLLLLALPAGAAEFFVIDVKDAATNAPISGAAFRTTNDLVHLSDRNGRIAFHEPGLMGQRVWFTITKPGYQRAADGFGFRGVALDVVEGGSAVVTLARTADPISGDVTHDDDTQLALGPVPSAAQRFRIEVVDRETGRGVPLVELADDRRKWVTDSNGLIAFYEHGRMGHALTFQVKSHGYQGATVALITTPGTAATVQLDRINLAERLYRITGQGIYADSVLLDAGTPLVAPVLNAQVMGQDTVQTTVHNGRVFWIWGDTNRAAYPLGSFRAAGARSDLPSDGGLSAGAGVNLEYFTAASGFAKEMAPNATVPGPGATWLGGLVSVPSSDGGSVLFASFGKFETLTEVFGGVARYDEDAGVFETLHVFDGGTSDVRPGAHPLVFGEYAYSYPHIRIAATAEAHADPSSYERYTPINAAGEVERGADGEVLYKWRTGSRAVTSDDVKAKRLGADELLTGHLREPDTDERVQVPDNSSIAFNPYRGRFVGIHQQAWGKSSLLGETWYAESDTPLGPWVYGRKVVTHVGYSFYNPRHHPFLDEDDGRTIHFEGTYTTLFTQGIEPTPRYDYNQIMYRLRLDAPELNLPVPIYELETGELTTRARLTHKDRIARIAFFTHERPTAGARPFGAYAPCRGSGVFEMEERFFVPLAEGAPPPPENRVTLYRFHERGSGRAVRFGVDPQRFPEDRWERVESVGWVYPNPQKVIPPVADFLPPLVANAGVSRCVEQDANSARATVNLDGRRSSTAEGEPVATYSWTWNELGNDGEPIDRNAMGATPTIELPFGTHRIALSVEDGRGNVAHADTWVQVSAGPNARADPVIVPACSCGHATAFNTLGLLLSLSLLARTRGRRRRN